MIKKNFVCDLNNCFLCKNCLKEWLSAIAAHKTNYKVKKGEVIFREGDPVTGIYFTYTGTVKVYKKWESDKELIIRFANNGAMFGHRGLSNDGIYPVSASALEESMI
jgi:CRP-like cAMP-binding protein